MKKGRFSEAQIVAILQQQISGQTVAQIVLGHYLINILVWKYFYGEYSGMNEPNKRLFCSSLIENSVLFVATWTVLASFLQQPDLNSVLFVATWVALHLPQNPRPALVRLRADIRSRGHAPRRSRPSVGGPHPAAAYRLAHQPHQLLRGLRRTYPLCPAFSKYSRLHALLAALGLIGDGIGLTDVTEPVRTRNNFVGQTRKLLFRR
jgi:hypothetical protein